MKFAVYILITNQVDSRVTNWYCMMVTPCPDGSGDCPSYTSTGSAATSYTLCEDYCQVQRVKPFRKNEVTVIKGSTSSSCSAL